MRQVLFILISILTVVGAFAYWKTKTNFESSSYWIRPPGSTPESESLASAQLESVWKSCHEFWKGHPDENCSLEVISQKPFEFSWRRLDQTEEGRVEIKILNGSAENFRARASHEESPIVWFVDQSGSLSCNLDRPEECEWSKHFDHKELVDEVHSVGGKVKNNAVKLE